MCGIAGIVRLNSKSGYNIQKRASMMSHMLSHRGLIMMASGFLKKKKLL